MAELNHRRPSGYRVTDSVEAYRGPIFGVRKDQVEFPDGTIATRDIVTHRGAVAVLAVDDEDCIVLIEQYRHAVGQFLWELPAGLRDLDGEPPVVAAQRELAEEVALGADQWDTLVDLVTASGFSEERVRVFLARGLHDVARPIEFNVEHEEADLIVRHVPIDDAIAAVHDGAIINSIAVAGILAVGRALGDSALLRPADAPWVAQR